MALREEKKLQTRQALMDAALTLMHEGAGFSGLSLREVSRQAGLVPTGFYRHFPDLDALGEELAVEACRQLRVVMRQVRKKAQGGAAITESVTALVEFIRHNPLYFEFLARERAGGPPKVRETIHTQMRQFVAELAEDLQQWPIYTDFPRDDLAMLADLVVNTVIHLALDLLALPYVEDDAEQVLRTTKQLRLIMLGAHAWKPEKGA
ncbi:TetR family transcriptional regulator [Paraperlucidibaca wandonensis]|jgi:AcrR family transcriptional regulator|uniref:TetR family transcriptional regulator n=1 Tax=Paraperlucidibaca wandonensis TaxID=1268273 RepID=A0ABW3HIZ3_9GAMM|nr:TetR family transcriptional regulator [Paraperlucidibaca sp.]MBQ0723606.1 TetR family transcriptional regulator [Paraperlucidibaca sp.]MBQ0842869.1 TetR family transcriptional regulator [Paraperlucidibaca sp.]|tara:strand:- start:3383 stop:4003 length:621 start_codon:yes stop_codon:yes gene_type:complete